MRDLVPIAHSRLRLPESSLQPAGLAIDPATSTTFVVSHAPPNPSSGLAAFQIFAITDGVTQTTKSLVKVDLVALTDQISSKQNGQSQVRSFTYLSDGGSAVDDQPALCLITAGGDIVLVPVEPEGDAPAEPQIVGSVEQGILAAGWSPDEEAVVLVVPADGDEAGSSSSSNTSRLPKEKMLVMSREFEVLDEKLIREQGRGEGE